LFAPLGDVEEPKIPFEVTSIDITDPYPTTLRGNKYPHFYWSPDEVCWGVSYTRSHGRNMCEGIL